jgi:hypothetical protein
MGRVSGLCLQEWISDSVNYTWAEHLSSVRPGLGHSRKYDMIPALHSSSTRGFYLSLGRALHWIWLYTVIDLHTHAIWRATQAR